MLRKLYSLSHNDWEALLARQNYSCAICLTHEAELKQGLAVDHCHKSNVVRGLLCHACNRALGLLREDFTRFERAMDYLLGIH